MEMEDLSSREPDDGERWGRREGEKGDVGSGSNVKRAREVYKDRVESEEEEQFVINQGREDDSDDDTQDDISWERQ